MFFLVSHVWFYMSDNTLLRHTSFPSNQIIANLTFFINGKLKGRVGKFEKPARNTLFVVFHGMLF